MRIGASPDVVEHIRANGGQVFVWTVGLVYGYGFEHVFTLEASTSSPGPDHEFLMFRGEGFDVLYDPGGRGTPAEILLKLSGRRKGKRLLRAYWEGHSFSTDEAG